MAFPRFVYQSPGDVRYSGGASYRLKVVNSEDELGQHLSADWFASEVEAIQAAGDRAYLHGLNKKQAARMSTVLAKRKKPLAAAVAAPPAPAPAPAPAPTPAPEDNTPPTRAEIEEQCRRLGLRVDGRYSDRRLLSMIEEAMR